MGFKAFVRDARQPVIALQGQDSVVASWLLGRCAIKEAPLLVCYFNSLLLQKSHLIPLSGRDETWLMWTGDDCSTLRTIFAPGHIG